MLSQCFFLQCVNPFPNKPWFLREVVGRGREVVGRGFNPWSRKIKVYKTGSNGFPSPPPPALWIRGVALQLARQCQEETWICELSPLNN